MTTTECAGCLGRGLGTVCRMCDLPIPDHFVLRPTDPPDPNPGLDLYTFNAVIEYFSALREGATQ